MRNNEWHDARVVGSRPARTLPKNPKSAEANFEYYVHYDGYDRRNDEWVTYKRINKEIGSVQTSKKTDHGTPDESGKTINHDPHEGIDDKQMQLHEQCTKYK